MRRVHREMTAWAGRRGLALHRALGVSLEGPVTEINYIDCPCPSEEAWEALERWGAEAGCTVARRASTARLTGTYSQVTAVLDLALPRIELIVMPWAGEMLMRALAHPYRVVVGCPGPVVWEIRVYGTPEDLDVIEEGLGLAQRRMPVGEA